MQPERRFGLEYRRSGWRLSHPGRQPCGIDPKAKNPRGLGGQSPPGPSSLRQRSAFSTPNDDPQKTVATWEAVRFRDEGLAAGLPGSGKLWGRAMSPTAPCLRCGLLGDRSLSGRLFGRHLVAWPCCFGEVTIAGTHSTAPSSQNPTDRRRVTFVERSWILSGNPLTICDLCPNRRKIPRWIDSGRSTHGPSVNSMT